MEPVVISFKGFIADYLGETKDIWDKILTSKSGHHRGQPGRTSWWLVPVGNTVLHEWWAERLGKGQHITHENIANIQFFFA